MAEQSGGFVPAAPSSPVETALPVVPRVLDAHKTCGDCDHAQPIPGNKQLMQRHCYGAPPVAVAIPHPNGIMIQMVRPVVEITERACGMHKPKPLGG